MTRKERREMRKTWKAVGKELWNMSMEEAKAQLARIRKECEKKEKPNE
ncbi:MAG: hypothetical protein LUD47_03200 [Clostridia bacterium]|nr:hypothetical protein [Clostridia bacterium]